MLSDRAIYGNERMGMRSLYVTLWTPSRRTTGAGAHLGWTPASLDRLRAAAEMLVPRQRIMAAVLEEDSPWWSRALEGVPTCNIIEQPFDRGSAPGILLASLRARSRELDAMMLFVHAGFSEDLGAIYTRLASTRRRSGDRLICTHSSAHTPVMLASANAIIDAAREVTPEVLDLVEPLSETAYGAHALDALYPFLPAMDLEQEVVASARGRIELVTFDSERSQPAHG